MRGESGLEKKKNRIKISAQHRALREKEQDRWLGRQTPRGACEKGGHSTVNTSGRGGIVGEGKRERKRERERSHTNSEAN